MKILFAPCHYIFGPNSGSESSWSYEIADRMSTKYPECVVITGFQKDKFNEKSIQNSDKKLQNSNKEDYEIIELQSEKSIVDMSLQNALLFNWKYFVKTREILKNEKLENSNQNSNQSENSTKFDTKFQVIHHCLPFAIGSTYNLAALLGFFSDKKFVIGPLQTGLNYRDADIDPRNFRSSNSNNSKSKFNLTTFFTGFLAQIVKPILRFLSHQTLLKADKIIAINKATFDLLISKNIPKNKIQIINPGLDLGKFKFLPKIQNETYLESQFSTQTQNPNQSLNPNQKLTQNLENQRINETQNTEFDKEKTTQNSKEMEKVEIELEDNFENKTKVGNQNETENKQENQVFEILSVGYLLERKGVNLLIKAVKILKTDLENERNKQIPEDISNLDSTSNLDNISHSQKSQKNNFQTNSQNNLTNSGSLSGNSDDLESNSQNNSEQSLNEKIQGLDKNVNKINSTIPKIHLNILGDGPQTENLKKLVLELDLEQNVTFMGFVDNSKVAKFYQKADVFVSMSKAESWGQMYLEAMACGLAIITTQNVGSNEIINSQTGILVPQLGVDELVQNLKLLIQNPAKKLQIATNARRELEQKYD